MEFNRDIIKNYQKNVKQLLPGDCTSDENIFFSILDLQFDECWRINQGKRGFWVNRDDLLKHFIQGRFYVLSIPNMNDQKSEIRKQFLALNLEIQPLFNNKFYLMGPYRCIMPAFCCLDENKSCSMLWVHPFYRRKGLASIFVKHFGFKHVSYILEEAKPFWDKMSITYDICQKSTTQTMNEILFEMISDKEDPLPEYDYDNISKKESPKEILTPLCTGNIKKRSADSKKDKSHMKKKKKNQ